MAALNSFKDGARLYDSKWGLFGTISHKDSRAGVPLGMFGTDPVNFSLLASLIYVHFVYDGSPRPSEFPDVVDFPKEVVLGVWKDENLVPLFKNVDFSHLMETESR